MKNHPILNSKRRKHSKESKEKMRQAKLKNPTRYWLGKKISKEHNAKLQAGKLAKPREYKPLGVEARAKISATLKKKYALGEIVSPFATMPKRYGKDSGNWRGGTTERGQMIRRSLKYTQWRMSILERDDFICKKCGARGGKLHVDHIKPFSKYPELIFEPSNARTLCIPCHRATDTWGCHQKTT